MQVIKFGGTSVARPEKLVDIVSKAIGKDRTILVCSAISGCTDALIALGNKAAAKDRAYLEDLEALKQKHISLAEQLKVFSKGSLQDREVPQLMSYKL